MVADWTDEVKDNMVGLVVALNASEVSLHSSEPDMANPEATILDVFADDFVTMISGHYIMTAGDWAEIATEGIYRQATNVGDLIFGVAEGGGSWTARWIVVWDGTQGQPSFTPLGKIKLQTAQPFDAGAYVAIPAGKLVLRAAGVPAAT